MAFDRPPPDLQKLITAWEQFEAGEESPGRVLANLKTAGLPEVDIGGPDERRRILSRLPALAPYFALGDRVVVVFEGTVYRLRAGSGAPN